MEAKRKPRGPSFDVTRVIGTVEVDPNGKESAGMAAFRLIDDIMSDGHDGEYTFQIPGAPVVRVTIGQEHLER